MSLRRRTGDSGPGGLTALMSAARWSNDTAILKHLLDAGAAIDLQDDVGRTALMFATYVNFTGALQTRIVGRSASASPALATLLRIGCGAMAPLSSTR